MNIVSVTELLTGHGLNSPSLNVLVADVNNYSVLLFQPQGQIDATQAGIRNRDSAFASAQFGGFLEKAKVMQADLIVAPEYSTPWNVLRAAIEAPNKGPVDGKLWALGCESITYSELTRIKAELANIATVVFEEMEPDGEKFLDPLAYVFRTTESHGNGHSKLVVLVQFKTHAMADKHEFEKNWLQLGSTVYQFGNYGAGISLTSLICSDAFAVTDEVSNKVYDRALILHIQLNPEPRHQKFLECRAKLLGFFGDNTEIICLNWASDIKIWNDNKCNSWGNIAGSAWYGKIQEFDCHDSTLSQNHRRGLYYASLKHHHAHALFLNFSPGVYLLTASKVARMGVPGPVGVRRGPQLDAVLNWDSVNRTWTTTMNSDDGFLAIVDNCGDAAEQVRTIFNVCPLACERLLALCAGNSDVSLDWFCPTKLDSFALDQRELIFRVTFCQDSHQESTNFRVLRLSRVAHLWAILQTPHLLPEVLKADVNGFVLDWTPNEPHQNLRFAGGERATVMYLGEDSDNAMIERTYKAARERIRRSLNEEAADRAKQHVVLWYRDIHDNLQHRWDKPAIDRQRDESEYDIGRMS
jgi:hypothetical protein